MNEKDSHESGQAIVFIVLVLVGLLGFAALAIDGGRLYSEHRHAQNTADAAALAGALVIGNYYAADPFNIPQQIKNQAINTALERARTNNYDDANPAIEVIANVLGPYRDYGVYYLVTVSITSEIAATLAQIIYPGPLENTVNAVARVRLSQNAVFGYTLFGTSKHDCKTIWFNGTQDTVIHGGGVFSNSDANSKSCMSGVAGGNGSTIVYGEGVFSVGGFDVGPNATLSPAPVTGVPQVDLPNVPLPDCSGLPNYGGMRINQAGPVSINPGVYDYIVVQANADVTMNPGLYCINSGTGFQANGGSISGNGVLIYLQNGSFDLGGNTLVNLHAPTNLVDPSGNQWSGMLVRVDPGNTDVVIINGTSNSTYTGTIYAPSADCDVNGTGDNLGLWSQVICNTVKFTGTAFVDLTYNPDMNYHLPPVMDLLE